jgi:hypothetical protein
MQVLAGRILHAFIPAMTLTLALALAIGSSQG